MVRNAFIIVGASGHARVCLDILSALGRTVLGFCDDNPALKGVFIDGYPVLGEINAAAARFRNREVDFFVAVGNNRHRHELVNSLKLHGISPAATIIHPSAIISPRVTLGSGNFIGPGVIINTGAIIKNYAIINTGATLDHDNLIQNFAQISPGCNLAGNVTVEEFAFLGTGAVIIPHRTIGAHAVIGAGAVVTRDIPPGSTAVGVPARVIKFHANE
jgi:UDP-perosamine 4-acetyltransferase